MRTLALPLIAALLGPALCRAQPCSPFWSSPQIPFADIVRSLASFDDGTGLALYATGDFYSGSTELEAVWRLQDGHWQPVGAAELVGTGIKLYVLHDGQGTRLYSQGYRRMPSGPSEWWLKWWNGAAWLDGPMGFRDPVVGYWPRFTGFDQNGPITVGTRPSSSVFRSFLTRWTGAAWEDMGPEFDGWPAAYCMFDSGGGPRLHMAGGFSTPVLRVGAWVGTAWQPVGTSFTVWPGTPRAMCVFNDGSGDALYLAGNQGTGPFANCIAKWNGNTWSSVGGGVSSQPGSWNPQINTMAVFDDGSGPALFVAGVFDHAGGVPARNAAKWNGMSWSALGAGLGGDIYDMAVYQDLRGSSLFISGNFQFAGGGQSPRLAQWVGCPNCYPNCDNSTTSPRLNIADFTCFLQKFAKSDPYANCNVDAAINIADFACFLQKFAAGCP